MPSHLRDFREAQYLAHSSWSERVPVTIEVMLPQLNLGCDGGELTLLWETMGASSCPIPV